MKTNNEPLIKIEDEGVRNMVGKFCGGLRNNNNGIGMEHEINLTDKHKRYIYETI